MAFTPKRDEQDYPASMVWRGTENSARRICDWARDDALIPFAAVTPPDRNAKAGTPEATYRLKIHTPVPAELGGGTQWIDVPTGATIEHAGTRIDPVFTVRPDARQAAASTFTQKE